MTDNSMDDRREYDESAECPVCPKCLGELTSEGACYRCDRELIEKQQGSVTVDENNQFKREWKFKRGWRD
mgnify:CR=1 FL=1